MKDPIRMAKNPRPAPKTEVRWQLDETIAIVVGPDSLGVNRRRVVIPYLSSCKACEGIDGYYRIDKDGNKLIGQENHVDDRRKAYEIALVQFGLTSIQFWDNSPPRMCSDDCYQERRANRSPPYWWEEEIVSDTGWRLAPGAQPSRGWHPYERVLEFKSELSATRLDALKTFVKHDPSTPNGQGKPTVQKGEGATYRVSAYCDSSD